MHPVVGNRTDPRKTTEEFEYCNRFSDEKTLTPQEKRLANDLLQAFQQVC
tara:strand:- start:25788 stop:25937 length:150 start_codon:yes stop_codon:yes gene_type:complete